MKKMDILLKLFSSPRVHLINSDVQKIFPLHFWKVLHVGNNIVKTIPHSHGPAETIKNAVCMLGQ